MKSFTLFSCLLLLTTTHASAQKDSSELHNDFVTLKIDIADLAGNEDQFRQSVLYNGKKISAVWAINETVAQIAPDDTILYVRLTYFVAKDSLVYEEYFACNGSLIHACIGRMVSVRDPELPADYPPKPTGIGELNYYYEKGQYLTRYTMSGTRPEAGWETPEAARLRYTERFLAIEDRLKKKSKSK